MSVPLFPGFLVYPLTKVASAPRVSNDMLRLIDLGPPSEVRVELGALLIRPDDFERLQRAMSNPDAHDYLASGYASPMMRDLHEVFLAQWLEMDSQGLRGCNWAARVEKALQAKDTQRRETGEQTLWDSPRLRKLGARLIQPADLDRVLEERSKKAGQGQIGPLYEQMTQAARRLWGNQPPSATDRKADIERELGFLDERKDRDLTGSTCEAVKNAATILRPIPSKHGGRRST